MSVAQTKKILILNIHFNCIFTLINEYYNEYKYLQLKQLSYLQIFANDLYLLNYCIPPRYKNGMFFLYLRFTTFYWIPPLHSFGDVSNLYWSRSAALPQNRMGLPLHRWTSSTYQVTPSIPKLSKTYATKIKVVCWIVHL